MATLAQVTALVEAHARRDHGRFRILALQIAADAAGRSAQGAERLRRLVEQQQAPIRVLPAASGLFSAPPELPELDDVVLAAAVRERLDRVVLEHGRRSALREHGLDPARKLLFTGPPGVGKTMSAGALARAVGLPMLRVELHGLISSHLGETASKLARVFEHVGEVPAVYLFDEFDAIGADRGAVSDGSSAGAEMRRVVSSLLQLIEDDRSESLIVAATNHGHMLDCAIFRRFDETISFALPSRQELAEMLRRALGSEAAELLDLDAICASANSSGLGHADVRAALDRARKDRVLVGVAIDTARVVEGLATRARAVYSEGRGPFVGGLA